MKDLFGGTESEVIRTLGFYQPFGTLMFHGKVETRWVKAGKKPPFPLGQYLFYTTQKNCDRSTLHDWCGVGVAEMIDHTLLNDETQVLDGYAIGMGELYKVELLKHDDLSYVKFVGQKAFTDKEGNPVEKTQWALHFKNVNRILPFKWNYGKQGVGFVPKSELIKIIKPTTI